MSNLELNLAANFKLAAIEVDRAISDGNFDDARWFAGQAVDAANDALEYLQELQRLGLEVPLTWTAWRSRKNKGA